jgi:hypothetical protein
LCNWSAFFTSLSPSIHLHFPRPAARIQTSIPPRPLASSVPCRPQCPTYCHTPSMPPELRASTTPCRCI